MVLSLPPDTDSSHLLMGINIFIFIFISGSLASTELLPQDASQWVYAGVSSTDPLGGLLPYARYELKGATLGDKLIMIGDMH